MNIKGLYIDFFSFSLSRKNFFSLLVAVGLGGTARGHIYWDDGDTIGKWFHISHVRQKSVLWVSNNEKQ